MKQKLHLGLAIIALAIISACGASSPSFSELPRPVDDNSIIYLESTFKLDIPGADPAYADGIIAVDFARGTYASHNPHDDNLLFFTNGVDFHCVSDVGGSLSEDIAQGFVIAGGARKHVLKVCG